MYPEIIPPMIEPIKTGYFQSVGQLLMFQGMIVLGLMILFYTLKEIVKEIYEYVRNRLFADRKNLQ